MQQANQPPKFLQPLAQNDASKADIPVTSPDDTRASQSLGFPPRTGQPPEAGGVPPQLPDMNGVLNLASRPGWWAQLGGRFGYDSTFATDPLINGYPQGATLPAGDGLGDWISTANDNAVNPDTVGTGWVPGYSYGATALASQTGGTVTLTPAQARKRVLTVAGTLTSNLVLVVPNWRYDWTVFNNTGGAFSVTVRTSGGSGAAIPQNGAPSPVLCDGVNCALSAPNIGPATSAGQALQLGQAGGRLIGIQIFDASGTYTPAPGTSLIVVEAVGGGGAGGSCAATSASQQATGSGGGAGGYIKARLPVPVGTAAVTVGAAGVPAAAGANPGGAGGGSAFGSALLAPGGSGGIGGAAAAASLGIGNVFTGGVPTSTGAILAIQPGQTGAPNLVLGLNMIASGAGGASPWGRGGEPVIASTIGSSGRPATGFGSGGSGAAQVPNNAGDQGGAGSGGRVVVYEYA